MIDFIEIKLEKGKLDGDLLAAFIRPDYNTYHGNIGAMKVKQTQSGVMFRGSIAKYLNGENISAIDRDGVKAGIEKLEKET